MGSCTSAPDEEAFGKKITPTPIHDDSESQTQMQQLSSTNTNELLSSSKSSEEMLIKSDIAKRQRRRLSVTPNHVGDLTGSAKNENIVAIELDPEERAVTGSQLSQIDRLKQVQVHKIQHAVRSKKGAVPYNAEKFNQDRAFIRYALGKDKDVALFGVCDGHGKNGHMVAGFVQNMLPKLLDQQEDLKSNTSQAIQSAVEKLVKKLHASRINIDFSGTTCIFGVYYSYHLFVANIGDSRCILLQYNNEGDFHAEPLSFDHKPELSVERDRIISAGGRIHKLPGPIDEDCGPLRVWLEHADVPGLAMSRSIGDSVSQTVGVISQPEILEYEIDTVNDVMLIFASDGVWEFLSNENVASIVIPLRRNLHEAATALIDHAVQQWKMHEEVVDDITAIVLSIAARNPPVMTDK